MTSYCEIEWRPMTLFKGRECQWKCSRWGNDFNHTLNMLRAELVRNEIEDVVIETYHQYSQYTVGGRPKAGIDPNQPAVQIFFNAGTIPVCIPSSMYGDWDQNLKAIQMTLRGRRLEREAYGCATIEEQYQGHSQLPPGGSTMTSTGGGPVASALMLLNLAQITSMKTEDVLGDPEVFHKVFKAATIKAHPDKGGSQEMQAAVNRAREEIGAFKGW